VDKAIDSFVKRFPLLELRSCLLLLGLAYQAKGQKEKARRAEGVSGESSGRR
jgi:hypothetical protein